MKRIMHKLLVSLCVALWASALSAQTHFNCDPYQFQYDMTIYFMLQNNGRNVRNLENYEVAAYVGEECRGVGEFITAKGETGKTLTYGYLRVYSNLSSGESITFKCYDKTENKELEVTATAIDFEANAVVGYPSTPQSLSIDTGEEPVLLGDADDDGVVDLTDAVAVFEYYMNGEYPNFNEVAADFDCDGTVDLTDAVLIFEFYMNQ